MRILVVSMWPSAAAPERGIFVQQQVTALRDLGHEVEVAALTEVRSGRIRTPVKYARLLLQGRRLARTFRPDVVHGHFLLPTGWVARNIAHRFDIPYVVTAHGTDVRNAEELAGVRLRTEPVVRDAAGVIAVSDPLAERLAELYPGLDVAVCDMGVDTSMFRPARPRSDDSTDVRFVAVGSLLENKNHSRLVEAVAQLDGAGLTCIGEGPQREYLEGRVRELGVHERVAFPGRMPHSDLPRWFGAASAACLVSLDEGFGLAALEALACGCPIVVSQTAPVAALVEDGVTGVVVDPEDVDDIAAGLRMAAAIGRVSAEAVARALAGRSVRERAAQVVDVLEAAAVRRR